MPPQPSVPPFAIREIWAVNPTPDGRPRRIDVIGVSRQPHLRLMVTLQPLDAEEQARFLDEQDANRLQLSSRLVALHDERVWVAEFSVTRHPDLAFLTSGQLVEPLSVVVRHVDATGPQISNPQQFDRLPIAAGFDIGVLFIHGIGNQRSAETLLQGALALQQRITAEFDAATVHLTRQLDVNHVRAWELSIVTRRSLWEGPGDYLDRSELARQVRAEAERTAPPDRKTLGFLALRWANVIRDLYDDEKEGRDQIVKRMTAVGASAVTGRARFVAAPLLEPARDAAEPSNATLSIEAIEPDGYVRRSSWLCAEAHWADTFRAPEIDAFGRWALQAAPIAFCYYYGTIVRRSAHHPLRQLYLLIRLAVLVTTIEAALLVLLALAIVPIPKLRAALAEVQRGLTGVLGDSYIFMTDGLQQRAILDRVQRDLSWLQSRCRQVIVVAHSQGAAVTYEALRRWDEGAAAKLHSIVTLGSGFQTLKILPESIGSAEVMISGWLAIGGVVLGGIAGCQLAAGSYVGGSLTALAGMVFLGLGGLRARNVYSEEPFSLSPWMGRFRPWRDFYAAFDPVPAGPVVVKRKENRLYKSRRIHNQDSLLKDHTEYWSNPEHFIGPLAKHIAKAAGYRPLRKFFADDPLALKTAWRARAFRVALLRHVRWIVGLCVLVLLAAEWNALNQVLPWAGPWLMERLGFQSGSATVPDLRWAAVLLPLLPPLAYTALLFPLWRMWGGAELHDILRRQRRIRTRIWRGLFVFTAIGLMHFVAVVASGRPATPFAIAWLVLAGLTTILVSAFGPRSRADRRQRTRRRTSRR